jgi:hypothetical protein
MTLRSSRAPLALLLLLLVSSTLRADVTLDSLTPAEGTVGTQLDLRLMGDTGKGKPKVWFTLAGDTANKPKKTKLKVTDLSSLGGDLSSLAVSFSKTKTGAGVYDLHVKPKGKGQVEQVFKAAFTMRAPTVARVSPDVAAPKDIVMITGDFFGSPKKPAVFIAPSAGGKRKKAKVQQVMGGTTLVVKLPKLKAGTYDLLVANKVGEALLAAGLTITGRRGGNGTDRLSMTLSSPQQPLLTNSFVAEGRLTGPGSFVSAFNGSSQFGDITIITALMLIGGESIGLSMSFPFNPGVTPTPFTVQMGDNPDFFGFLVSQSEPAADWGDDGIIPGSLTVTSASANRVTGTYSFTLVPIGDDPAADDLEMTQGMFDVSVQAAR